MSGDRLGVRKMGDILEVAFQKVEGTAYLAPYVQAFVCNLFGSETTSVLLRVDSGADITAVPRHLFDDWKLCHAKSIDIIDHAGSIKRISPVLMRITINGWTFHPVDGVLMRDNCSYGLLGMDVLRHLSITMENERLILRRMDAGMDKPCPADAGSGGKSGDNG